MSRRIAVVTSSRADYGHLYWPLKEIEAHPELELDLLVFGAHLSPLFGNTVELIERDGFEIGTKIECLDPEDSDTAMARTIGNAIGPMADYLDAHRPDLLLIIADRYEMLAPASVALAMRIPIAHIEGGDISEGAVDDAVRNALTKMSHLHFTPTQDARRRVLAMGEEAWRVTWSGAPSLDHLRRSDIPGRDALQATLGRSLGDDVCVVAYHPVTLHQNTTDEADSLMQALAEWTGQIVFCFPNADAGRNLLIERSRAFCESRSDASLHVNLDHLSYWALLENATLMIGNSSSGIMESASLKLPCIDIGDRQQGRTRAANIVHADADTGAIVAAMGQAADPAFIGALGNLENPYGDGHAAERIVNGLATAPSRDILLTKRALPLETDRHAYRQAADTSR
jgi:UDP-N-acetylglucosamine 2-epimerase (non-hydrolysing)/GDP/UDP-N,N'-diacetylbacillosamine 2-epimerase (hydrolysing)